ncbi:MAG: hypothetical protein ACYDH8_09885 [Syntrophales bacterium]
MAFLPSGSARKRSTSRSREGLSIKTAASASRSLRQVAIFFALSWATAVRCISTFCRTVPSWTR